MTRKTTIAIIVIVVIIGALTVLTIFSKKFPKNDTYVTGNTGGNLNNSGLYCEKDGTVYFANPEDHGFLYSMSVDESNYKKILATSIESINADDNRIYYVMSGSSTGSGLGYIRKASGMFSIRKNGGDSICYTQDPVGIASLSGNYLYYQHYRKPTGTDVDRITIDKKDNETLVANMASPASADAGYIYYAGDDEDHYLYVLDTSSGQSTLLYEHNMYAPIYQNGYIFYMDLESNYHLRRYSLSSGEDVELTSNRVDMFNVYGNMIYYQLDSSSPSAALMRMTTDGAGEEVVLEGIYCDINITSQYVYFHPYDSMSPTYHQSVNGPVSPTVFFPKVEN